MYKPVLPSGCVILAIVFRGGHKYYRISSKNHYTKLLSSVYVSLDIFFPFFFSKKENTLHTRNTVWDAHTFTKHSRTQAIKLIRSSINNQ